MVITPPITAGKHLFDFLFELGPGKGDAALEAPDLPGWEYVLGVKFQPWEMRALIRLSREYLMATHQSKNWNAQPPFQIVANQWRWVRSKQAERNVEKIKAVAEQEAAEDEKRKKRKPRNGDRQ